VVALLSMRFHATHRPPAGLPPRADSYDGQRHRIAEWLSPEEPGGGYFFATAHF